MSGPVVLITGCTEGGIGDAFAQEFAKRGCKVFATARRVESMGALDGCEKYALDVTDPASIESTISKVIQEAGHIDILINNAGAPGMGALLDVDMETARKCLNVNVFGVLALSRTVAKHMVKRGSGKIATVGSVAAYASAPWGGIYSTSKAAVHSLMDTLRMELSPFNIHVTVIAPGAIKSNFGTNASSLINVPEDSLYKSVAKYIYLRATMSQGSFSTPANVFAAYVATRLLRQRPPRYITYGTFSPRYLLFYYLPLFIKEYIFSKKLGVFEVKLVADK